MIGFIESMYYYFAFVADAHAALDGAGGGHGGTRAVPTGSVSAASAYPTPAAISERMLCWGASLAGACSGKNSSWASRTQPRAI
jgi:hypothetical protein